MVVIWIVCVVACVVLASNKGRSVGGWLVLALLLGPIALILAAVVSNKTAERQTVEKMSARAAGEATLRKCPFCAECIRKEAAVCRYCGRDVPSESMRALTAPEPTGSASRGRVYIAVGAVVAVVSIFRAFQGGSSSSTVTSSPVPMSTVSPHIATLAEITPPNDPEKPYVIKLKQITALDGKRSYDLQLVYRKPPALKDAYAAAAGEVAAWVRAHYDPNFLDIWGDVEIGDPDKPDSWIQMKDVPKGWVFVWFDQKTNAVSKHLRKPESLVPNVLSGAALQANAAEATRRDADRAFNKTKSAAFGARLLKKSMRNPASFELIEVGISSTGADCYKFRAQNGFGGMNVDEAVFGNTFKTSGQAGFAEAWNRDCGGKTWTMVTDEVNTLLSLAHE